MSDEFSFEEAFAPATTAPDEGHFSFEDAFTPPDRTFQSQLATKVPEVMSDMGVTFDKVEGLSDSESQTLNNLKKQVVLDEAKKRVFESPLMGMGRGARDTAIGAAEFARSPAGLGLLGLTTIAPPLGALAMGGLGAEAIGQSSGRLSVPGGTSREMTQDILGPALMTLGARESARMLPRSVGSLADLVSKDLRMPQEVIPEPPVAQSTPEAVPTPEMPYAEAKAAIPEPVPETPVDPEVEQARLAQEMGQEAPKEPETFSFEEALAPPTLQEIADIKARAEKSASKPLEPLKFTPDEIGWGQPAEEPVWRPITAEEAKSPAALTSFLTKDARIEGSTEPVSRTRRLIAMQAQDGSVHIVSTYKGPRGVMAVDPEFSGSARPNRQLPEILKKYTPLYSLLKDEPVQNFHQKFDSLQDFYGRFGDEASIKAREHVAPEPTQVTEPIVPEETGPVGATTSELGELHNAIDKTKPPQAIREAMLTGSRQAHSALRKYVQNIIEKDPAISPVEAVEKAFETIYEDAKSTQNKAAFVQAALRRLGSEDAPGAQMAGVREGAAAQQGQPTGKVVLPEPPDPTHYLGGGLGMVDTTTVPAMESFHGFSDSLKKLPEKARLAWRSFAMQALPRITRSSKIAGEAGARLASAPMFAKAQGEVFVAKVMEGIKEPGFDVKFGTALKEDNLRAIRHDLQKGGKKADANRVATLIAVEGSPFKTEGEYQDFLESDNAKKAIARHIQLWQEQKDPMFRKANDLDPEVELPGRGYQTGARINLTFVPEGEGTPTTVGRARRSSLVRQAATVVRRDPFARQAKGTGTSYEGSYSETMKRAFEREYPVAAQHEFYKSLLDSGDAVLTSQERPQGLKIKDEPIGPKAELMRLKAWKGQWMQIRKSLAPEFEAVTGLTPALKLPLITPINDFLTKQSIRGFAEGSNHAGNLMMQIFTGLGPTANPMLNALLKPLSRIDLAYTLPKVIIKGFTNQKEAMMKLMEIGAAKEPYTGILGPILNGVDRGVRLVSADIYNKMADKGWVPKGETGLREFVNQVGQYNHKLQPWWISKLRETVQPFATATHTFNVMGLRRMALGSGAKGTSNLAGLALRADIAGGIVGFVVLKSVLQKLLTGNVNGPPGTQAGNIGWIGDDKKLHQYPLGRLTGYDRGPRITGIQPYIEAKRLGLSSNTAITQGAQAVGRTALSYFTGPGVQFATRALTGSRPGVPMVQEAKVSPPQKDMNLLKSQAAENIKNALKTANPIVDAAVSRSQGKPMSEVLDRQFPRYLEKSGMSESTIKALPEIVRRGELENYAVDIARQARKLPIMERGAFIQQQFNKDGLDGRDRAEAWNSITHRHGVFKP